MKSKRQLLKALFHTGGIAILGADAWLGNSTFQRIIIYGYAHYVEANPFIVWGEFLASIAGIAYLIYIGSHLLKKAIFQGGE